MREEKISKVNEVVSDLIETRKHVWSIQQIQDVIDEKAKIKVP